MSTLPRVYALLAPREQMQLEAATVDRLTLLQRPTVHRIYADVAAGHADGVIISAAVVREADVPRLGALVHELPAVPVVGLVSDGAAGTVAGTLLLGRAGIARLIDVRDRTGWGALRNAFTLELPQQSVRAALVSILNAIEVKPDGTHVPCTEAMRRFFSAIFAAHAITARRIAAEFGMPSSTLNSRFYRAGLPSPKQYLALARLVRAAYLGEAHGLTLKIIAERLQFSSPQSYSRTVRNLTGMCGGEFRRAVHGPAMMERFMMAVVTPYREVLREFDPLHSKTLLTGATPSDQAA
jgi:AraC-like DNA-binding protein